MFSIPRLGRGAALALLGCTALLAQEAPPSIQYGPLTIHGFELREAAFDPPFRTTGSDGVTVLHRGGWQIVIRGDGFPVRALDPILWVDDVPLVNYERHQLAGEQELAFNVIDPKLLRAEHSLQVIYGRDERTRTRLLERFDPEKLVKLPDDRRQALGIGELDSLRLLAVDASGRIAGRAKLGEGSVRLAARFANDKVALLPAPVTIGKDGAFSVDAGPLPAGATDVVALLVLPAAPAASGAPAANADADARLSGLDLAHLPKGVELLDRKPVGAKGR